MDLLCFVLSCVCYVHGCILEGIGFLLFDQYYCLRVNRVYAEINTFLPPFSKRLFIAMIHRKVFNVKTVDIQYMWRKFLRNIRE